MPLEANRQSNERVYLPLVLILEGVIYDYIGSQKGN
jgi:hypothetical protein